MGQHKFNRRDMRETRQKAALVRQEARSKLSPQEQLAVLDGRFGEGVGATKERAKLAKQLGK